MPLDTIIKSGTVVTATDRFESDIGIENGRISVLARNLDDAPEVIDATGLLVMPGGIDSHVHLDQPGSPGIVMADNFSTGTRSAAVGGNTTVLPFCLQTKGQTLRQAITDYKRKAEGNCHVDVAFHLIVSDPTPQAIISSDLPAWCGT